MRGRPTFRPLGARYKWLVGDAGSKAHAVPAPGTFRKPTEGVGSGITHGALCGRWLLATTPRAHWAGPEELRCGHCLRLVLHQNVETTN